MRTPSRRRHEAPSPRTLRACAQGPPQRELSPKQALYLRQIVVRYRRQIAADVVRLARDELRELEAASA